AFALLPFLAAGHVHKTPPNSMKAVSRYHETVGAGLKWLVGRQATQGNEKGYFGGDTYTHALATMALCEAYALSGDPKLKGPAQMAVDYLLRTQHDGG